MAFPESAVLVVDRLASGPGPPRPLNITFTPSFAPSHVPRLLAGGRAGRRSHGGGVRGRR
jgi:hypothetical protein